MNIIESICTKSDCYKVGKKIVVKGIMIHSVGCSQSKAQPFINNWNKSGVNACVHAIVEPGGDVYQLLPWDNRGWHGGGSSNNTHIGVEMTEPDTIKYIGGASWKEIGDGTNTKAHVLATYKHAVELFAMLCKKFALDPLEDGVIISHSEGNKRGIASNHGDVEHLWKHFNLTMEQFRKDIKNAMDAEDTYGITKNKGNSVFSSTIVEPYFVKVTLKDLNIRKGPGVNYARTHYIPVGVYTIVEESEGQGATKWGRLKSDEGWISLDYVTKL